MSNITFAPPNASANKRSMSFRIVAIVCSLALVSAIGAVVYYGVHLRVTGKIYFVPSASMTPTLEVGDRVRAGNLALHGAIKRYSIVIFAPGLKEPDVKTGVKRVIGLPGETIEAKDGKVLINGTALNEGYLAPGTNTSNLPLTVIPADSYFLLGDNRKNSSDSRFFGSIARSQITGHVTEVVLPGSRRGQKLQ